MNMNLSILQETVKDREAWSALVRGVLKSRTRLNDSAVTTWILSAVLLWADSLP